MWSGQLTGSGHFLGTPGYMAPEQIEGPGADGRTGPYALAIPAFELLTGTVRSPAARAGHGVAHLNTQPPAPAPATYAAHRRRRAPTLICGTCAPGSSPPLADPIGPVPHVLGGAGNCAVDPVAFSPDGAALATSGTDGSAYLWRVR